MRTIYKTSWTPTRIKEFRKDNFLSQENLAQLLTSPQQRVSEWEKGLHAMKRPYSLLFDIMSEKIAAIKIQANGSEAKYRRLMLESFGVKLSEVIRWEK